MRLPSIYVSPAMVGDQQAELSQVLAQVRVIQARLAGKSATRPRIRAAKNGATPAKTPKAAPPNTKDAVNPLVAEASQRSADLRR